MWTAMLIIFGIMILEGLNLTGIPAIVILPTVGLLAAEGSLHIGSVLAITILGSIVGNVIYYLVIRMIGPKIYDKIYEKFKGMRKSLDKADVLVTKYGNKTCCIGRVIPGVRTVVSLVAGTFKIHFTQFLGYSTIGIIVWNGVLVLVGYFFGGVL
ncbi:MAG: DedA family protein [Cellulosilyticaceae bacterium]